MNQRKTNGNERMSGGRSRGQRKDHYRDGGGMNSFHNGNNYQRQKMKNSNIPINRNDSFSKTQERFENKELDFPVLGDNQDRRMHDRLLFVIMNMVGTKVEATIKNGTVYEGILHGTNTEGELGVCLKMARKKNDENNQSNAYIPNLIIMSKELAQISVKDIELNKHEKPNMRDTFKTDTAISGRSGEIFERQLQRWEPEKGNYDVSLDLNEDSAEKWDQFETNEKLFGITTDFDEEIYTTPLDRSKPDFKKREQEALKVAAEIEKSCTENIHLAEERNQIIDDSGIDEEDRYGAVIRKPGKYVPPNIRKQMEAVEAKHEQQLQLQQQQQQQHSLNKETKANLQSTPEPKKDTKQSIDTKGSKQNTPKEQSKEIEPKSAQPNGVSTPVSVNITSTTPSTTPTKGPLAKLEKKIIQSEHPLNKGLNPVTMQENLVNHFRQFSKKEKEHLAQKKQAIMKQKKEGILSEFKSFSKNFKLPDFKELPSDMDLLASSDKTGKEILKPTFEKDKKEHQKKEIQKKESTTKQVNKKKSTQLTTNNENTSQTTSVTTKTTSSTNATSTSTTTTTTSNTNNNLKSSSIASSKTKQSSSQTTSTTTPAVSNKSELSSKAKISTSNTNTSSDNKVTNGHETDLTISESVTSTTSNESKNMSFKFNIEAREFKPNPSAAEFVPSTRAPSLKGSNNSTSNDKGSFFNNNNNSNKRNQKGIMSIKSIYIKGFLKTQNINNKNNITTNQGSATWSYGSRPFKTHFSVTYDETIYAPIDQQFGYYNIQPYPYQAQPMIRRPYMPAITMQPGTISTYPVNYVPAPYGTPITHNRPIYQPNIMGPMGPRMYQGPVIVPAYQPDMIHQFPNSVMIHQQQFIIEPTMIPTATPGIPQTVFLSEALMEVPPEQSQT